MAEIQRLRRKFILVGTLAVIIIVVGALGLINTISYMRMQHSVFSLLTSISENGGQLPRREGERPSSWIEDPDWYNDSPESIYQIRYFSIVLDRLGNVEDVNLSRIASFSESCPERHRITEGSGNLSQEPGKLQLYGDAP